MCRVKASPPDGASEQAGIALQQADLQLTDDSDLQQTPAAENTDTLFHKSDSFALNLSRPQREVLK